MNALVWSMKDVDFGRIEIARDEAQNALQWLARMAASFADADRRQHDLRLFWNGAARSVTTPEVAPGVVLELRLPSLVLQFMEAGKPSPHALDVEGKSSAEVEAWLLVEMLHRGFEREIFSKQLPYRWSRLMAGDEMKFEPEAHEAELRCVADWFANAATVLLQVEQRLPGARSGHAGALDLACWPDCFQIGFVARPNGGEAGLKVGFAIGDDEGAAPFFFVRREASEAGFPSIGGAVLTAARIERDHMTEDDVVRVLVRKVAEASG